MALLARLKPYNERKGHLTRTYMIDGARFFVDRGWYQVSEDLGAKLRTLHQDHYDEDSPLLFDVCTPAEAEKLERAEQKQVEEKATPRRPAQVVTRSSRAQVASATASGNESGDLTSADLKSPPAMLDPDPDGKELEEPDADEGRAVEVGRVSGGRTQPPKPRRRGGS